MKILHVKWAPLNIPLERRLQTLAALFWIGSFLLGGPLGILLTIYLIIYTRAWILVLTYLLWMYIDRFTAHRGGRRLNWLRQLGLWMHFRDFFPIHLKKTVNLNPDRNYLFCVYPHGLLSAGVFGNFATESPEFVKEFPQIEVSCTTLDMHFNMPFFREYAAAFGTVAASRESILHLLCSPDKGKAVVLIVGGAAEALYAHPNNYRVVLNKRKGFIKLALKSGSPLVPVFSFGENELYDQVANPPGSLLLRIQNILRAYTGIAPCLAIGRGILQYSFGVIPRRCPITTVVGKPIEVPLEKEPSEKLVEEYHEKFKNALIELFNEHKKKYLRDPDNCALVIVE